MNRYSSLCVAWLLLLLLSQPAAADVFGSGANEFSIRFVRVDQPGNPPDENPNPAGAVPYRYRIGKYEVSERMIDRANAQSALEGEPLGITKDTRGPNKPATSVTWYEAAQFVNWLNTTTGHTPAYKFDEEDNFQLWDEEDEGYDADNLYRNRLARYFLPSLNEWHKTAYYDPLAGVYYDYPTGSDSIPDGIDFPGDSDFAAVFFDGGANPAPNDILNVGVLSPYGTAGQGGNVREWIETAFDRINNEPNEHRKMHGGSWGDVYTLMDASNTLIGWTPQFDGNFVGLRVASVIPEPTSMALLGMGLIGVLWIRRRIRT